MDADTLNELRLTLRRVFAAGADPSVVNKDLADLGWDDARHDDPARTDVAFFEEQGRALAASDVLNTSLCEALGVDVGTGVTIPVRARSGDLAILLTDVIPEKLVVGDLRSAVFLTKSDIDPHDIGPHGIGLLDTTLGARRVVLRADASGRPVDGAAWSAALTAARRSLASELVGVGLEALALAITYVSQRTQFGRPIGSFQAVRHRLAEAHVHLTAAQELVGAAWNSGDADDACLAKAAAGRAADHTMRTAMQVFGAIGLTWEHKLHGYVRRAASLDALAGESGFLEERLGRRLVDGAITP
ncbi:MULTISPECIES: acyl-CoA dehydrogenase family protein [Frankia]|nr:MULTISPECIES: acyl-CoA dehydrogenase family protein [Frankia]